jgi:16S rRNA (guanine1207-N2)-methyltransferase
MDLGHYFDASPAVASDPRTVTLVLPDLTVELRTDRGVFSAERVDPGTRLLLLEAPFPPPTGDLLDLGCGYGPVALALARRAPAARVWATDVNRRALSLTSANAHALGLENVTVSRPTAIPHTQRFAAIYSNPPVRIGKVALHQVLDEWLPRGDVTWMVVSKHLGADSLARWMSDDRGWSVERVASRVSYRVLRVRPAVEGCS